MSGSTDINPTVPAQVATVAEPGSLLKGIMDLARDPSVRIDVIELLSKMQISMEDRQAEREFAAAMHAAQAKIKRVMRGGTVKLERKDGTSGGTYDFARMEDIDDVLRPIMDEFGFSITFNRVQREGGGLIVTGKLRHVAGHFESAEFPLPIDTGPGRNNLQALGSTDSYARRYLLEGFFNIVRKGRDDDGKSFGKKFVTPEQADELRGLIRQAGFDESTWLERRAGGSIRSAEEVEHQGYVILVNMLHQVISQRTKKA